MPLDPPPVESGLPDCAVEYLFQLNNAFYYRTINCLTGVSGFGISPTLLAGPLGCVGTTCPPANIVRTAFVAAPCDCMEKAFAAAPGAASLEQPVPVPLPVQAADLPFFRSVLSTHVSHFRTRYAGNAAPNDVSLNRRNVGTWLNDHINDFDTSLNSSVYLNAAFNYLLRARLDVNSTSLPVEIFRISIMDRQYQLRPKLDLSGPIDLQSNPTYTATSPPSPNAIARAQVRLTPGAGLTDLFFNFFQIQYASGGKTVSFYVASQLASSAVPGGLVPLAATFADRHSYVHILQVTMPGGVNQPVLATTAQNIAICESFV